MSLKANIYNKFICRGTAMLMSQLKVHFSEQACQPLKNREHEHSDRAFFVAAPRVWNNLPSSVTASQTLGTFRRPLKTHIFAVSLT